MAIEISRKKTPGFVHITFTFVSPDQTKAKKKENGRLRCFFLPEIAGILYYYKSMPSPCELKPAGSIHEMILNSELRYE